MKMLIKLLAYAAVSLMALSVPAFSGELDDYYLAAFSEQAAAQTNSALQKAVLLPATETVEASHCGTPLKHRLHQDWAKLEPATQKALAKTVAQLPVWVGTTSESKYQLTGGHFLIHYTATGSDAPPLTDANANGIPDWVETVARTYEDVATAYTDRGWRLAPTVSGATYDVYLRNLAPQGLYGQTTTSQALPSAGFANAFTSFMEIDNNFTEDIYTKASSNGGVPQFAPLQSLQVTAAHEYHHAIQYGYNVFFDIWYAEATSTWHEDELYDGVNQGYTYIPAWFQNSGLSLDTDTNVNTGGGYGRWIFNRFLAERYGTGIIRSAWEKLATLSSPGGTNPDIPMVPVLEGLLPGSPFNSTLGTEFFGFTKRVYLRDWSTHTSDIGQIHPYAPVETVSSYPANATATINHYAFSFVKFTPSAAVPTLTVTLSKTSGIQATVFKTVAGAISEVSPGPAGNSFTVSGFGSLNSATDEVVVLLANITNVNNHQASFSTIGQPSPVTEPSNIPASTQPSASAPASGGGGGGGGCFIATAAYGSYLHPQVRVLRDFRDRFLLTNAPGRAFVALYYRLSPPLADFIARHETLRLLVRLLLTPVVFAIGHLALSSAALVLAASGALFMRRRRTDRFAGVN